ncbi:hypothetical protein JCM31271_19740 [Halorubrum trueperi]
MRTHWADRVAESVVGNRGRGGSHAALRAVEHRRVFRSHVSYYHGYTDWYAHTNARLDRDRAGGSDRFVEDAPAGPSTGITTYIRSPNGGSPWPRISTRTGANARRRGSETRASTG